MHNVIEYNTINRITLQLIATESAMTKTAFCKNFKKCTNKTYFRFRNQFRIEKACNLLISNEGLSIAEVTDK